MQQLTLVPPDRTVDIENILTSERLGELSGELELVMTRHRGALLVSAR